MNKLFLILVSIVLIILIILYFIIKQKRKRLIKEKLNKMYINMLSNFKSNGINNNISGIDMIYCVTMPERKKYIKNTLLKLNSEVIFFDAVTPKNLSRDDYELLSDTFNLTNQIMYRKMTKLPVHLSYTMCFMDALQKGYKNIIILEDDIIINMSNDIIQKSIQEFLSIDDFIMFYMGYCCMKCDQKFNKNKYKYLVNVPNKTLSCNHAIVFKMEYVPELLDFMYPMSKYSDNMFIDFFIKKKYKVCIPKTPYFDQDRNSFKSLNGHEGQELSTCNLINN